MLTEQEKHILELASDIWNECNDLPNKHPMDMQELARDLHNIQHRIMARVARGQHPELFA